MFSLLASLTGHTGDARCCCVLADGVTIVSGGRDNTARAWKPTNTTTSAPFEPGFVIGDDAWITSCVGLRSSTYGLALGTQSRSIKLYNVSGELQASMGGHTGPVTSLAALPPLESKRDTTHVVSGSWDGCVRVWDLASLTCVRILPGVENGVSVLALNDGRLISGSSGVARGNAIVDIHLRLWPQKAASTPEREKPEFVVPREETAQGPIRSVAGLTSSDGTVTKIVATANDGTTRVYRLTAASALECVQTMVNPAGLDTQGPAMNLGACFVAGTSPADPELCVASDDMCARVWRDGVVEEELEHPATVWATCALANGDLVTAGSDGAVRVFTRAPAAMLSPEAVAFREEAAAARQAVRERSKGSAIDPSSVARIEDAGPGTKDGQYKMFNKNGVVFAYQWAASSQTWLEIGEAMSNDADKQELDGEMFDLVVPVEIDDQRGGSAAAGNTKNKLRIGFNRGDNPYVVATNFLKKNELPDYYLEEIVQFIKVQSGEQAAPTSSSQQAATPTISPPFVKPVNKRAFPFHDALGLAFEKGSVEKAVAKVLELASASNDASILAHRQDLLDLQETLRNTSRYHASLVSPRQFDVLVRRLTAWPVKDRFPQYDLCRAVLLHPDGASKFTGVSGSTFFSEACATASSPTCPTPTRLTALRAAANMFRTPASINAALSACRDASAAPIERVSEALGANPGMDANSRIAASTLLVNVANALNHSPTSDHDAAVLAQCYRGSIALLKSASGRAHEENLVVVPRSLLCVGCVATSAQHLIDPGTWAAIKSELARSPNVDKLIAEIDDALSSST